MYRKYIRCKTITIKSQVVSIALFYRYNILYSDVVHGIGAHV